MMTAVQELTGGDAKEERHCRVVYGTPTMRRSGRRGQVYLFQPGCLVAYEVRARRCVNGFVFRTLARTEPHAQDLAGVRPAVRLLAALTTERQLARCRELFSLLEAHRGAASGWADLVILRAAVSLAGRQPVAQLAAALSLEH